MSAMLHPTEVATLAALRVLERKHITPPDPVAFSHDVLGIPPDPWQADVLRSTAQRLLLNCSRQSGKSTTAATLALYTAIYRPGSTTLLVSPSQRQSSELFRKIRHLIRDMPNPPALVEDNKLSLETVTGSRIVSLPASEGTVRGVSAVDLLIEDEASRVPDALYFAVRPMLAVSNGRLILMSTPFGKRGHFWDTWSSGVNWEKTSITALECPRITREFLDDELVAMGHWWYRQEYMCEFADNEDSIFSHDEVMRAMDDAVLPLFGGAL